MRQKQPEAVFYRNNRMTVSLEWALKDCESFEAFERMFGEEFLNEDTQIGDYLESLLIKYDQSAAGVSREAGRAFSYVGHIINGKRKNPSRDVLISICLAIGTTFEEAQYLLRYAGCAPLYVRRKRDVVIWFGFMKGMKVPEVDDELAKRGLKLLVREK